MSDETTEFPTDAMHEIANRQTRKCLAAFGAELMKGVCAWQGGRDPEAFIREAIVDALMEQAHAG